MLRKGFTLAEILIALVLIGIIAALTLPALNANVMSAKIGPSLSKANNTLINGNGILSSKDFGSNLFANSVESFEDYLTRLEEVVDMSKAPQLQSAPEYTSYTSNSTDLYTANFTNRKPYLTKDGFAFYFIPTLNQYENAPDKYAGYGVEVIVDINGIKPPNIIGKDAFYFVLDGTGAVIPIGGYQYNIYNLGEDKAAEEQPLWDVAASACKKNNVKAGGRYCAGAVADNNWAANY